MTPAAPTTARVWFALLLALMGSDAISAQIYRRPRLRAGEDTNDASAYVRFAQSALYSPTDSAHAAAEAALIWAGRLDPGSGDPPYLLAVAVFRPIMMQARRAGRWSRGLLRRELTPRRLRYLDSLMREAWLREPFYDIGLEPLLNPDLVAPERVKDPAARGYFAYKWGDHQLALDSWAEALAREPRRVDLRLHRAHTFHWMQRYDSTVAELRAALATTALPDSEQTGMLPPEYVLQYAMAVAFERAGQADSAKEAYRRALGGNLGLYMARVRLSHILFEEGDTAEAVGEIAYAVDIAPREPWLASYYGYLLLQAGRPRDAIAELQTAIALDSAYATPYFLLGMAHTTLQQGTAALTSLEGFLSRSPAADERRGWTMQRVSTLRAQLSGSVGPHE